ncbi:MAG: hypothetical protein MnENMB40S_22630 [Rhizobiaceae bacterium MnEN-MB40S]|nr:MAG: hypothetical protein MnENMB40S_22630 [Rhizobiaceae bacterium MnEN-MB40S]
MQPLRSEIVVEHNGTVVHLRPSLRAAYLLEEKHKSFGRLVEGVQTLNITVIEDILDVTSDHNPDARRLLIGKVTDNGVRDLQHLLLPLFDVIATCYGVDGDPKDETPEQSAKKRERPGKSFSMRRMLDEAYTIATAWLGWSPNEALDSTPAQIAMSWEAYVKRHNAMTGQGDQNSNATEFDPRDLPTDEEVREGIARLRAMSGRA